MLEELFVSVKSNEMSVPTGAALGVFTIILGLVGLGTLKLIGAKLSSASGNYPYALVFGIGLLAVYMIVNGAVLLACELKKCKTYYQANTKQRSTFYMGNLEVKWWHALIAALIVLAFVLAVPWRSIFTRPPGKTATIEESLGQFGQTTVV